MQIKLFTIPIIDNEIEQSEMNRFLAGHKILTIDNHLVSNDGGAYWCFCICYTEKPIGAGGFHKSKRVDYKKILDVPPALQSGKKAAECPVLVG